MEKYTVTGMSCAACQARVEKAVGAVEGVTSCSVSLLTNSMGVEGSASSADIIKAVKIAGYGASKQGESKADEQDDYSQLLKDTETPVLKKRLIYSVFFLAALMYISMGHMIGARLPGFLDNPASVGTLEMLLAIIVMVINAKFFTSGFKSLIAKAPNMDTLVALGSSASFAYSLVSLFMIFYALDNGNGSKAMSLQMGLYFETAAMIPTLITVGKLLEAISKGRTTDALKGLIRLSPQTATVVRDGKETEVSIKDVNVGDVIAVKTGESIPVDAVIIKGNASVDESALTGESVPVDKAEGDSVFAATINSSGYILAKAEKVGKDTALSKIITLVSDAAATKAPIARIADKVSAVFVPAVIIISLLTFGIWLLAGKAFSFAVARAISVLVISCPCALGLATPVAIMVGNGVGAKNAILFKTASSQEIAGEIAVCALDKTGTITEGKPQVTDIVPFSGYSDDKLLSFAYSLECMSDHPLAKAISGYAEGYSAKKYEADDFYETAGKGVSAKIDGLEVIGGSFSRISAIVDNADEMKAKCDEFSLQGKTPMCFSIDGKAAGIIAVSDTIKPDSVKAVKELENMGIKAVMITGDNEKTANAIAKQAGIKHIISGVLPDGKDKVIKDLKKEGLVAMVGDGINDAIALTSADVGIAIGAGADIAIDAADIVLMKSRLTDVSAAVRLSRATIRNIHQNLFWAFFYNVICIPLAAGFYSAVFGLGFEMNPMVGAAAMSISSFTVCMNALRLNLLNIHDTKWDKRLSFKAKNNEKECQTMTKTMTIEGMMCGHCEATVKKALEAIDGVSSAEVSHEKGTAVIELSADVDNAVLTKAVEEKDFDVKGIA